MDHTYPPPVARLLTLGRPDPDEWIDYPAAGLADEHVPALMALLGDEALGWGEWEYGMDETPFWATVHAWRALGQLRAVSAVAPLIRELSVNGKDDWTLEEVPRVMGMIGAAALPEVATALRAAAREGDTWPAILLASALREIGERNPDARGRAVEVLERQLRLWEVQDAELNGFLVCDLVQLRAVEAAPVMQEAYAAGAVDESIQGDWEDAQVELGLLAQRITPAPDFLLPMPRRVRPAAPVPGSNSAAATSRKLRRAQKRTAKKKRRR